MVNTTGEDNPPSILGLGEMEEADISSRDTGILQAIQEEGLTVFTFDGLKRMLGVHLYFCKLFGCLIVDSHVPMDAFRLVGTYTNIESNNHDNSMSRSVLYRLFKNCLKKRKISIKVTDVTIGIQNHSRNMCRDHTLGRVCLMIDWHV